MGKYDKLIKINAWTDDERYITKFIAFTKYSIDTKGDNLHYCKS